MSWAVAPNWVIARGRWIGFGVLLAAAVLVVATWPTGSAVAREVVDLLEAGMLESKPRKPWFHGSPVELTSLHTGSTVMQNRALARVFSHRPALVTVSDEGEIRHNGTEQGHLYLIAEDVRAGDVTPHPRTTMARGEELLTTRELRVKRLRITVPDPGEQLAETEIASLIGQLDSL